MGAYVWFDFKLFCRYDNDNAVGVSVRAVAAALDAVCVDDLLTSASTEEELIVLIGELGRLLSSRGFHLTKYSSNSERVLATVPRDRLAHRIEVSSMAICPLVRRIMQLRIALLRWQKIEKKPVTKRGIVSMTSQFLQPYLLVAMLIVQRVCKDVTSWDDDIGEDNLAAMKDWFSATSCLQSIKLPRCCFGLAEAASIELHTFSDRSTMGMGVVSYLKI